MPKTKTKTKNQYCGSKRYLVFAGLPWEDHARALPWAGSGVVGGWGDLQDGVDTKSEALKCAKLFRLDGAPWAYVVDTKTGALSRFSRPSCRRARSS